MVKERDRRETSCSSRRPCGLIAPLTASEVFVAGRTAIHWDLTGNRSGRQSGRESLAKSIPLNYHAAPAAESVRLIAGELLKRCIQLCSTTPVTAHRQMLLRRMFCGRLLISPHPVAAHHSTSSSATLNSRPHRYSRGSPRPEVRGLRHSRGHLSRGAVSAKPSLTGCEWSEQMAVQRKSNLVDSGNPNSMPRPETDRRLLEVAATRS